MNLEKRLLDLQEQFGINDAEVILLLALHPVFINKDFREKIYDYNIFTYCSEMTGLTEDRVIELLVPTAQLFSSGILVDLYESNNHFNYSEFSRAFILDGKEMTDDNMEFLLHKALLNYEKSWKECVSESCSSTR